MGLFPATSFVTQCFDRSNGHCTERRSQSTCQSNHHQDPKREQRDPVVHLRILKVLVIRHGATVSSNPTATINPRLPLTNMSTVDSITTKFTMLALVAPSAFRTPISLVRSFTPMANMLATPCARQQGHQSDAPNEKPNAIKNGGIHRILFVVVVHLTPRASSG